MNSFEAVYIFSGVLLCCVAVFIWITRLEPCVFLQKEYWQFLLRPWKGATFVGTTLFMVLIAPYSGDYTWDYIDGFFMSAFTYISAPWAVGIFFRYIRRQASLRQVFLAFCLWMFSASWSYDIYLCFRDGLYPLTSLSNLAVSTIVYWSAGLFWNLGWAPDKGVYYAFTENAWFNYYNGLVFLKILRRGWMFVLLAVIILGGTVLLLNLHGGLHG